MQKIIDRKTENLTKPARLTAYLFDTLPPGTDFDYEKIESDTGLTWREIYDVCAYHDELKDVLLAWSTGVPRQFHKPDTVLSLIDFTGVKDMKTSA